VFGFVADAIISAFALLDFFAAIPADELGFVSHPKNNLHALSNAPEKTPMAIRTTNTVIHNAIMKSVDVQSSNIFTRLSRHTHADFSVFDTFHDHQQEVWCQ